MVLIIYGRKEITKTIGSGTFNCPSCRSEQPYWQKTVQEKGHLYWIGVLPIGKKLEYVECRTCGEIFQPEVLSFTPKNADDHFRSDFELVLRRLMVLMILADGNAGETEIEMLIGKFEHISGQRLTRDEVIAEISAVNIEGNSLMEYAGALAHVLTDEAKELVIKAVFSIAAADETIHHSEMDAVVKIAEGLEMSEAHLNGVMASLLEK